MIILLTLMITAISLESYGISREDTINLSAESADTVNFSSNTIYGVLFPGAQRPLLNNRHFAIGAEIGSSVDLTSHNLTTFDADINCGYSNKVFPLIGIGFGIHRSIGNANSFIPVYGIIRSYLRKKTSNFFLNLKVGYSFNTLSSAAREGGFLTSVGLGMNLKRTRSLTSYILLAYGFYHINEHQVNDLQLDVNHIDFAQIIFGVSF